MATVQEILNTDLPKPTWAWTPSRDNPLRPELSFSRSTAGYALNDKGIYERVPAGMPRFQDGGLLMEEQMTNLIDHRSVGAGGWTSISSTPGMVGIDGTTNAVEIEDQDTSNRTYSDYTHSISSPSQDTYSFTLWLRKKVGGPNVEVHLECGGGKVIAFIDTETGEYSFRISNGAFDIESVGAWWNPTLTVRNVGGASSVRVFVFPAGATSGLTKGDGSETGSVVVDAPSLVRWGRSPELDANGHPTHTMPNTPLLADSQSSYPTTVTRNADTVDIDATTFWNEGQGVLVMETTNYGSGYKVDTANPDSGTRLAEMNNHSFGFDERKASVKDASGVSVKADIPDGDMVGKRVRVASTFNHRVMRVAANGTTSPEGTHDGSFLNATTLGVQARVQRIVHGFWYAPEYPSQTALESLTR